MIVSKSLRWTEACAGLLLGGLLLITSAQARAESPVLDTLQMHGFLSQALVITDRNDFFGPSSSGLGSLKFTEIGANASIRPHQDVLIAAQVLSRRAGGDGSDAEPVLDYGIIDYQMLSNQRRTLGIQVGRFKNPFGFYNQTRDVAFTRPSILLPQSIYFDRTRSLALSADGALVYAEERLSKGTVRAYAGVGDTQAGDDLRRTLRLDAVRGDLKSKTSAIAQVRYEHDGGRFVAALTTASANARFESGTPGLGNGDFFFEPWVFSLQYNEELWSLTGEFALRKSGLEGFNDPRFNFDVTGESWYVQYTRRFHDDWQWLVRYDSLTSNRDDRSGKAFEASGAGPAHSQFADDITLGLQWNVNPRVLLAAEYHYVDGTGWLPIQDNPDPSETSRRWNMLLFQLSLRF
ncbi:OprO/OprP family phosphate-selective porin [Halomonas sp. EGI 63088]|uniref:OprO/OprP family phosphate-selective porin n=1 Tax=Halomonas flagellata TaxID=2920385 RepID=A0ABS9RR02_9GAMM|nr:OprO/OprP family phosphate-selective porin [Halomonas flagellata]MCH4562278.1 OprO/OprP family phosphate-selective porin [Halomonas flagellata]